MKKILSLLLSIAIVMCTVFTTNELTVQADESKILTLGADLTEEQKQLVIDYLGVDTSQVVVLTINNTDEHALLDGIATQQQIGTRTFSCSYIEPTSFGGIHIKTVNLSWVTCEMIRNALVTSGITNCNIICMSPIEVSGTGALTGIFKAYENVSGVELTEEVKELASEELITTCTIAGTVGQEEASTLVSELKEEVITNELTDEQIEETVKAYMEEHSITLTEDDMWRLIELLIKLSERDYDIEEIKQAYADIKQTASEVQESAEETVGFFQGIINWFKGIWNWITGKTEEVKESEQAQIIKEQMGILADTDDSLLGDSTVVTTTIEEEVIQEVNELDSNKESEDSSSSEATSEDSEASEKKGHWYDFIIAWFNTGNASKDEEDTPNETEDTESQESEEKKTFDDFESEAQEYQEELEQIESEQNSDESTGNSGEAEDGLLQYIQSDFENPSESSDNTQEDSSNDNTETVGSFNDLTE